MRTVTLAIEQDIHSRRRLGDVNTFSSLTLDLMYARAKHKDTPDGKLLNAAIGVFQNRRARNYVTSGTTRLAAQLSDAQILSKYSGA